MNIRFFLKSVVSLITSFPWINLSKRKSPVVGYTAKEIWEDGIFYAPYIPLYVWSPWSDGMDKLICSKM